MARYDQHMGLNEWARDFVEGDPLILYYEEGVRTYPDGRKEVVEERAVMGSTVTMEPSEKYYTGMFDDQYPLYRYRFVDGRTVEERIQANPWSSGPQFYKALVSIEDGKERWVVESLWSEFLDENVKSDSPANESGYEVEDYKESDEEDGDENHEENEENEYSRAEHDK